MNVRVSDKHKLEKTQRYHVVLLFSQFIKVSNEKGTMYEVQINEAVCSYQCLLNINKSLPSRGTIPDLFKHSDYLLVVRTHTFILKMNK